MDTIKKLSVECINPDGRDYQLLLFALSTCGFCRRAKRFLDTRNIKYHLIYIDYVEKMLKAEVKKEFRTLFDRDLRYPALLKNNQLALVGYIEKSWIDFFDKEGGSVLL